MSPKQTNRYEFYRNLPMIAPSLLSAFQKLDHSPDNPRCHFELGEAAFQAGLLDLSVECFVTVTQLAPQVDAGFFNLGNAYFELGQYDNAKCAYEQAMVLNPDCDTLNNLGNCFAAMEDWNAAIQAFDRAIGYASSPPQLRTALRNRGKALQASSNWVGAIENYRRAMVHFPNDVQFLMLKAICHHQVFEYGKAIESLVEALEIAPSNPELLCEIAHVNFCRGRTIESLMCMQHAFTLAKPPASLYSRWLQMSSFCDAISPERLLNEARQWAELFAVSTHANLIRSDSESETSETNPVLRIGILCQSLPSRGIGDWLPDCLSKCNPNRFHWFLFCNSPICDEVQAKIAQSGCHVEFTSKLSDGDLASKIFTQELTVVIDMIGHGLNNRLQVLAKKPAKILVSWCAFPMTSGLMQMRYLWSDAIAIPEEAEKFFSEQVVRFATSSYCFRPSCDLELQPQNRDPSSAFRCGFLGRPEQISDSLIAAMQSILGGIPNAELVFIGVAYQDAQYQSELRERLAPNGTAARICFECYECDGDELNSYQRLDVTLESFCVNATQRAFESLWMGVPVITLLDERLSGRSTASILHALQRDGWIARTTVEYVEAVKRLAENRLAKNQLDRQSDRERLRSELLNSPMCDTHLIAANIENAIDETILQSKLA